MNLPIYASTGQKAWYYSFRIICGLIFFFLIAPILIIIPLSFNATDFFTFTPEMLKLQPEGYSLKHYQDFFTNSDWQNAIRNSLKIAPVATLIAVVLGTIAAIGLSQSHVPFRRAIMATLISPMIVPLIISATGMYFFYARLGNYMVDSLGMNANLVEYIKIVLAHAALGIPFVIITVTATLVGFDRSLTRAAASMGSGPVRTFFKVQMPLIIPGVISGSLFAFITSFDEALFWMDQSLAFFESSKVLDNSPSEYTSMPIITLQSFSVECSLKALLLLSLDKYPEMHDSILLFGRLPDALKTDLSNKFFSEYTLNLKDALEATKGDFIGSRYHFEDFKKSYVGRTFSTGYLQALSDFFIKYRLCCINILQNTDF